MERKIGETFEFKGKTYEVAELPDYFCAFCDLEKECYSKRSYLENVAGTCSPSNRMVAMVVSLALVVYVITRP